MVDHSAPAGQPVLRVAELSIAFDTEEGEVTVVDKVNFHLQAGETLGLVGESGCGKSVTALAIMGLLPKPSGRLVGGSVAFQGETIASAGEDVRANLQDVRANLQGVRGNRIAMIFQEPMTALNPVQRIGRQLTEVFALHQSDLSAAEAAQRAQGLLEQVGIPAPARRLEEYPHELSGGMRQRVMIAMALACRPDVLIADEPTTALDVTIQAQILELLRELQEATGMAILFITHDLGVIAELCSRVVVMYAGRVVEQAVAQPLFQTPLHPYTRGLLASMPRLTDEPKSTLATIEGTVPAIHELPAGCRFANRCDHAVETCERPPPLETATDGREIACHRWREWAAA